MLLKYWKLKPLMNSIMIQSCKLSYNTSSITKVHRAIYARTYPTIVVLPNGASINIRYHEPRKIIRLPLDLSSLTEEERRNRMEKRRPKQKIIVEEDIEDTFNSKKYLSYLRK